MDDLGLGRLVGQRFLLLTQRGRRSGGLYGAVFEVTRFDPLTLGKPGAVGLGRARGLVS